MSSRGAWAWIVIASAAGLRAQDVGVPEVTVAGCLRTTRPPKLDAALDDACWRQAGEVTQWFDFAGARSRLRTEMKLAYDVRAMYVCVCCYEKDPSKIRAEVTRRQDGRIWKDDSLEIYVSPSNTGSAHLKFTVNSIGTRVDVMMDDQNRPRSDWRPESQKRWRAAATKTSAGWVAEVAIPWSDIGATPQAGDVWTFAAIRFSWVTGQYVADKTSPGARHGNKPGFGYVIFGTDLGAVFAQVHAATQARERTATWRLDLPDGTALRYEPYKAGLRRLVQEAKALANECRAALAGLNRSAEHAAEHRALTKELGSLAQKVRARPGPDSGDWRTLGKRVVDLRSRLAGLRARIALGYLLDSE